MRKLYKRTVIVLALSLLFFRLSAQFIVNGSAVSTSCECNTLTQTVNSQTGSAWNTNKINLSSSFDFTFSVFAGCSDGGADGFGFVLQNSSTAALGGVGNGMGFTGITPSLGVLLDNYENGSDADTWYDHISINKNGDMVHTTTNNLAGPVQTSTISTNIEDCANHTLRIIWNPGTQVFSVYFDGTLRVSYTGDIINTIFGGNPNVYWGFTGATGGLNNEQRFCHTITASANMLTNCSNSTVQFSDLSTSSLGNILSWQWDIDNNSTTDYTVQNPSHNYSSGGSKTYKLTVTDISGCSKTYTGSVNVAIGQLTLTPTITHVICNGQCNGSIVPTVSGGVAPFKYLWSTSSTLSSLSGLCVGNYSVSVTDNNNCGKKASYTIIQPIALTLVTGGIYTSCQCLCPGSVWAVPSGGTLSADGSYSYKWNTGINSFVLNDLCPGAFTVTVTDDNGCKIVGSKTIP